MNDAATPCDLERISRAARFAIVCVVLVFSYFSIRASLSISNFETIFRDMLGPSEQMPPLTVFVLQARALFIAVSLAIPVVSIALFFMSDVARSLYALGIVTLVSLIETIVLFHALSAPLAKIIAGMSAVPG